MCRLQVACSANEMHILQVVSTGVQDELHRSQCTKERSRSDSKWVEKLHVMSINGQSDIAVTKIAIQFSKNSKKPDVPSHAGNSEVSTNAATNN